MPERPRFSILIPARNEERFLPACLDAVARACAPYPGETETIVCLNRCTDRTADIARSRGARTVSEDAKCLSRIRNAAARAARGDILVTVDADSLVTRNMLMEIDAALADPSVVGGGCWIRPERISPGIALTGLLLLPYLYLYLGVSCGCFWCRREDFEAVGGFDESLLSAEDIDFALRLKRYGARHGRRFRMLWRAYIVTSCRKFDRFGDWYALRHIPEMLSLLAGRNRESADKLWYDFAANEPRADERTILPRTGSRASRQPPWQRL